MPYLLPTNRPPSNLSQFHPATDIRPDDESSLDVQFLGTTGYGNRNWYIEVKQGWIIGMVQRILSQLEAGKGAPSVISVSYGTEEDITCDTEEAQHTCRNLTHPGNASEYIDRANVELMKLGTLGITVVVASGDHGATVLPRENVADAMFPASSPYVTSVGASQLLNPVFNHTNHCLRLNATSVCIAARAASRECACTGNERVADVSVGGMITSGGGFSNFTSRSTYATYQAQAVDAYLSRQDVREATSHFHFNAAGRAYPDLAAVGSNIYFQLQDDRAETGLVGGTSAAAPIVAGLLARVTAEQIRAGRPALGFVNPMLYKVSTDFPEAFNDITVGNNSCVVRGRCDGSVGFIATQGWDATTGLGSINYGLFLEAVRRITAQKMTRN